MTNILFNFIKTVGEGSFGALSFGIYYQYNSNKMIQLNNKKIEMQYKHFTNKIENQHKNKMNELQNKNILLNNKLNILYQRI